MNLFFFILGMVAVCIGAGFVTWMLGFDDRPVAHKGMKRSEEAKANMRPAWIRRKERTQ